MHLGVERRPGPRWQDWHTLEVEVPATREGGIRVGDPLPVALEVAPLPDAEVALVARAGSRPTKSSGYGGGPSFTMQPGPCGQRTVLDDPALPSWRVFFFHGTYHFLIFT
jgi:hypothetical protein